MIVLHAILTLLDGLISLLILYRTPLGHVRSAFTKHTLALIMVSFGKTWSYLLLRNITISVNEFLQEQGFPVAPFYGYLIAQILPESFESLRLLANKRGIAFPSSCQDGVYRLVFAGNFMQLNHPGVTVDATLQFSYQAPTPGNYASGRRYRVVTVQDASSQHHYTALWFDVSRAQAEELLANGPHQVEISGSPGTIRWPQSLSDLGKRKNKRSTLETPTKHWERFRPTDGAVSGSRVPVVIVPDSADTNHFQRQCLNAAVSLYAVSPTVLCRQYFSKLLFPCSRCPNVQVMLRGRLSYSYTPLMTRH